VFYVPDDRFEPVGETEEAVEEQFELIEEVKEVVESDEYAGERVVRRVLGSLY